MTGASDERRQVDPEASRRVHDAGRRDHQDGAPGERTTAGGSIRLRRTPALTGVRAVAVVLVMIYHLGLPIYGGFLGVNVFFVLSGFLITYLILEERLERGRIAFGNFYLRRALRLYPALLALVAIVTLYSLIVPGAVRADDSISSIPAVLLYVANWVRAFPPSENPLGLYEHTWSLAIEEQFYLIWPLVVWLSLRVFTRIRWVAAVTVVGIAASTVTRLLLPTGDPGRISNGTDTMADQLLWGALLAIVSMEAIRAGREGMLRRLFSVAVWPALVALALVTLLWPHGGDGVGLRLTFTVIAVAAVTVIGYMYTVSGTFLTRLASAPTATYLGDRSYGLYLWHYPVYTVVFELGPAGAGRYLLMPVALALSIGAAELSYRLVEKPFLTIKDGLARRERAPRRGHVEHS
jgi:peptidoglycan/LPS O-acetylase OafA/YrhL